MPVSDNDKQPPESPRDLTTSLIAKLRAGDDEAGALLDAGYRKRLFGFCWCQLGSVQDAEDAVQEVFCSVLKAKQVPGLDTFEQWLFTVARNQCLNMRRDERRRKRNKALPSDACLDAQTTSNLTRLVKGEQRSHVFHRLGELTEAQREALWLRYVEEWSRAKIAEVLGVPQSVVKSRVYEGAKKLREHSSLRPVS
jgi:RNA polymerase sigma-70 factor (ECF subfamily)